VVVVLTAAWCYVRLVLFDDAILPLTFVLPLLVCLWTQRHWQLWSMAAVFVVAAGAKTYLLLSAAPAWTPLIAPFGTTLFNVLVGASVVDLLIRARKRLEESLARITSQHAELEAQAEELAQQNEELKTQAEELAQQNEEIESQSEELNVQNEELHDANERLRHREDALQALLESSRTQESSRNVLTEICHRALLIVGAPTETVAIYKLVNGTLRLKVHSGHKNSPPLPETWAPEGSLAAAVLEKDQTGYVSDVQKEPSLALPFSGPAGARSILASPMRIAGEPYGVLVACTRREGHWTQEQFRVLEWLAAQCALVAQSLRWQTALADRARDIEAANRAKDQFLAMLSHELRTPLTPVLAAASELEHDERIPQDAREDLQMIRRNISIQSRLVDDLLDLTKLERGKLMLELRSLDIGALLSETVAIVGPDLDAKDQRLVLDLRAVMGKRVLGDGPRLQQVFWNLLKNAIKFSPPKGQIGLTTTVTNDPPRVVVNVTDAGIGIDPAHLDLIFRPFEQVVDGGKQRGGDSGLGLGLSIARALVDLHHGAIRASSPGIGSGATFIVELPLEHDPKAASGTAASPGAGTDRRGLNILLVEDHSDTGRVLARLLRNSGHTVEYAESAAGATEAFGKNRFDLVISDLGLPDESGLALMRKLRARDPKTVGICLSGYGMEEDLQACREAGFSEHLTKPVDMQRLNAAITRVVSTLN
jgi:signal transduction histidine kinase